MIEIQIEPRMVSMDTGFRLAVKRGADSSESRLLGSSNSNELKVVVTATSILLCLVFDKINT
jgi:hypothetical protein